MIRSTFENIISNELLPENGVYTLSVLESCYDCINEGTTDLTVIKMSSTYTHSLMMEILENVKETLLKLYQQVLSVLNNYILNSVNLATKYRKILISRFESLKTSFPYKYYSYSGLSNYPVDVRDTVSYVERPVNELIEYGLSKDFNEDTMRLKVHDYIASFSNAVIGLEADPENLKDSVEKLCYMQMRGAEVTKILNASDLNKFIDDIGNYKNDRKELNATKASIIKHYDILKRSFSDSFKTSFKDDGSRSVYRTKDPEKAILLNNQVQQYSKANIRMTELFNGYIIIYNTAFNTKLKIIQDRVDINRNILVELMRKTNILTYVNLKPSSQRAQSLVLDPTLKI